MCDFCEINKEKVMIKKTNYHLSPLWMNPEGTYKAQEVETLCEFTEGLFIDRRCDTAYLRIADLMDCNCIEAGKKIEIKFCPCCGEKLV